MIEKSDNRLMEFQYNRTKALSYAHKWAFSRNADYLDFEKFGGDCTNFASQVIFAGSNIMNYTPIFGWYYLSSYNRTASWTGVEYLYNFLINNRSVGPYAEPVEIYDIEPGDIIQLSFEKDSVFQHSPVVVKTGNPIDYNNILIATHTDNQDYYPLTGYSWEKIRFIHIKGTRGT